MSASKLSGARILLVIAGGVAAYKALDLIRRLKERGAGVRVVMTDAAKQFVSPMTAAALSAAPVRENLFSLGDEAEMGHIELSRSADLIVVAPATANLLARMAHGLANDLASTLLVATDKRALVAPAMNVRMWLHPATQRNVATLKADGVAFVGPDEGEMACGEFGPGRMAEPLAIVAAIERELLSPTTIPLPARAPSGLLQGRRVVVTAGPTYEPIDPVRFLGNRSSGLQGFAIAEAARDAGAEVTLISGPVRLADPAGMRIVRVESARDMLAAVEAALPADVFVAAAAVADWRVATTAEQKLKKGAEGPPTLTLVENPDILATVGKSQRERPRVVVGFAAETENVVAHARAKLAKKGCDLVVANDVSQPRGVFGGDHNEVSLVSAAGAETWPRMTKVEVAEKLIVEIASYLD
ncbi:MAG: bifunctional phosphopantothenoylcysteine decarboxylase/phosphopantothenate--cysteine ligase CoaBC [Roseiarcus sp.]